MDLVKPNLVGGFFRHPFDQHMRQVKLDHLPRDRDEFNLNIFETTQNFLASESNKIIRMGRDIYDPKWNPNFGFGNYFYIHYTSAITNIRAMSTRICDTPGASNKTVFGISILLSVSSSFCELHRFFFREKLETTGIFQEVGISEPPTNISTKTSPEPTETRNTVSRHGPPRHGPKGTQDAGLKISTGGNSSRCGKLSFHQLETPRTSNPVAFKKNGTYMFSR